MACDQEGGVCRGPGAGDEQLGWGAGQNDEELGGGGGQD